MTGHGDIDVAVRAMKAGARDFLVKPTPLASIAGIASELMLDEMQGGLDRKGADRIVVQSAVSLFVNLPENYGTKIESIEGVEGYLNDLRLEHGLRSGSVPLQKSKPDQGCRDHR